jgi:hypothetical protein
MPIIANLQPSRYQVHPRISLLVLLILALCTCDALHAQSLPPGVGPVGDNLQHPLPGTGHDYIHLLSETVNPANGSLSIEIRLPSPPGRGINPPVALRYNSGEVSALVDPPGAGVVFATETTRSQQPQSLY